MKPYRQYDAEFKRQAVRMVVEDGRGIRDVERELGITIGVLKGWIKKHEQHRDAAFRGTVEPGSPEAEMRKLEKENRRLAEELAILKKQWPSSRATRTGIRVHSRAPLHVWSRADVPGVAGVSQRV